MSGTGIRDRHLEHFYGDPVVASFDAWHSLDGVTRIGREYENFRSAATLGLEQDRPAALLRGDEERAQEIVRLTQPSLAGAYIQHWLLISSLGATSESVREVQDAYWKIRPVSEQQALDAKHSRRSSARSSSAGQSRPSLDDPPHHDRELVEDVERDGQRHHRERVRAGGDHPGDHHDEDDGPPPP